MYSLQEYFDRARERRRAYSDEQIRELLDAACSGTASSVETGRSYPSAHYRKGIIMKIIGLVCLATALGTTATLHHGTEEHRTMRSGMAPALTGAGAGPRGNDARSRMDGQGARGLSDGMGDLPPGKSLVAAPLHPRSSAGDTISPITVVRPPVMLPMNDTASRGIAGTRIVELSQGDLATLGIVVDDRGIFSAWVEEGRTFACRIGMDGTE